MSVKSMHEALMEMAQNQSEAVAYNTKAAKSRLDDRRETNSRMLKRDFKKSGISHIHSTKTGPDGSKHDHFDIGKHTKVISTHNSYKVLHKGKETHFQGDPEHRDNRNRVIDKVLQHVGKNESIERAAWVPESILDDDVSHFMGAAAAAKKAGKSDFDFGGKKYKVTMKHDAAKKIGESAGCAECGPDGECQCEQPVQEAKVDELSTKTMKSYVKKASKQRDKAGDSYSNAALRRHDFAPDTPAMKKNAIKYKKRDSGVDMAQKKLAARESVEEKMDPKDHVKYNDEMEMYCVYNKAGKVVAKFKDQKQANDYAMKNHDDLMEAKAPGSTAQHGPTPETSDTYAKQMSTGDPDIPMSKKKDIVNMHKTEVSLDAEELYQKNKYEALSKTPGRMGDQTTGDKNPVNPIKVDVVDSMRKVLAQMKTEK